MPLTARQHQILVGTLLGDGCLERNGRHVRLKVDHGADQRAREYVLWKYDELRDLASGVPREVRVFDRRSGRIYTHFRFATRTLEELDEYHLIFYDHGRKRVPENIGDLLTTPLSLAVWFMDDGHRRTDCRALRINTQGYSFGENKLLCGVLERNFGVEARVHRVRDEMYVMYIPAAQANVFCDLVRPYVLKCMKYKLL